MEPKYEANESDGLLKHVSILAARVSVSLIMWQHHDQMLHRPGATMIIIAMVRAAMAMMIGRDSEIMMGSVTRPRLMGIIS